MPCEVWTARISSRDPDTYNVTRKSGDRVFAPSWSLVNRILTIRETRIETEEEWRDYGRAYLREMLRSHSRNAQAWEALLKRPRIVLTCYCTNPLRCHRTLLGRLLARLGATFHGELPKV